MTDDQTALACRFDDLCPQTFTSPDDLDDHDREHWAKEHRLNDYLRTHDRYWAFNSEPGRRPTTLTRRAVTTPGSGSLSAAAGPTTRSPDGCFAPRRNNCHAGRVTIIRNTQERRPEVAARNEASATIAEALEREMARRGLDRAQVVDNIARQTGVRPGRQWVSRTFTGGSHFTEQVPSEIPNDLLKRVVAGIEPDPEKAARLAARLGKLATRKSTDADSA